MGNFKIKSIWENKNTGGTAPAGLENRVQELETNAVKITGDQSIAGVKTFTSNNEVIKLNSGNNNSAYIAGYKSNNQRVWYFGKGSSTSDNLIIGADSGVIKLEPHTHIDVNNKKIINVATPTAINDAATKQYVDNKIQKRIIDRTITAGNSYAITPSNGYEIISVMVARKRASDGYYFFTHHTNLNFQVFLNNNQYWVYTEGSASGFSADYKIIVLEMKA